jgi:hypothetical protein
VIFLSNFFVFCHSYMFVLLLILIFFVMQNMTSMACVIKDRTSLGGRNSGKQLPNQLM